MTRRLDILPLLSALLLCLAIRPAISSTNAPDVVFTQTDSSVIITTDTALGGVFMIFDGIIEPTLVPTQMDMNANVVADSTRVLITSLTEWFGAGTVITYTGSAPLVVVQASDTFGLPLSTAINIETDVTTPDPDLLPGSFTLAQNYPNPFNPATTIEFTLPAAGPVTLDVFNELGRRVCRLIHRKLAAGTYRAEWNGLNDASEAVASGVYFYRLQFGDRHLSRKMLLLR